MSNQCERILKYMKEHGGITSRQAADDLGVMRLSARIWDLKREGIQIIKERVTSKNRYGEKVCFDRYKVV